jgi:8-oxo-dGTP diphosphatase
LSREYPERPFVGVGAVIFRDERVLLIQRGKPPRIGQWSLPGGVQEVGETVREAAAREVMEETGIEAEIRGLIDVVDSIQHDEQGRVRLHYTLVDVWGEWRAGEPVAGDDAMGAAWRSQPELEGLGLWSETLRVIGEARRLRRVAAGR